MINFGYITKQSIKEKNPNCSKIPDHPHRILMIGDAEFGKANALFDLKSWEIDIHKTYSYASNTNEKHFNDSKAFINYSDGVDGIYKNIEYNPNNKCKILKLYLIIRLLYEKCTTKTYSFELIDCTFASDNPFKKIF